MADKEFDWKGEAGDTYAEWNSSNMEGTNKMWTSFYGQSCSDVLGRVLQFLTTTQPPGLDVKTAKVLDIGCNTGGIMSVWESLGFDPANMSGVDLSPGAIKKAQKAHPSYNLQCVDGYDYATSSQIDLVYHTGVLCQITQEDYAAFFQKIRDINPRYYFIAEGVNPRGYEKIPNSVTGHHHHDHGQSDTSHHGDHHHGHGQSETSHGDHHHATVPMSEGYHYTDDHPKVVHQHLPGYKKVYGEDIKFTDSSKQWFEPLHMTYVAAYLYARDE